jgi:hypothetical protein
MTKSIESVIFMLHDVFGTRKRVRTNFCTFSKVRHEHRQIWYQVMLTIGQSESPGYVNVKWHN